VGGCLSCKHPHQVLLLLLSLLLLLLLLLLLQADPKVTSMYDAKLVRPELTVSHDRGSAQPDTKHTSRRSS
jgi:hypothetical protein